MPHHRIHADPERDAWEARRRQAEERYEEVVVDAAAAAIGSPRFVKAMEAVREAREELREIDRQGPTSSR